MFKYIPNKNMDMARVATEIASEEWNGKINNDLLDFEEYCEVVDLIADSVEAAL